MITETEIITKYLGLQYQHRGRYLLGFDCYGLIIHIYKDMGYKLWDIEEDYDEHWNFKGKNYFIENYHKQWVKVSKPALFDVVLFANSNGVANHGGVFLSNSRFIQCCLKVGVVIGRLNQPQWQKRLQGFYHLKVRDDIR